MKFTPYLRRQDPDSVSCLNVLVLGTDIAIFTRQT